MVLLFALSCWFHQPIVMTSQPPRVSHIHSNGQLRRPPGG